MLAPWDGSAFQALGLGLCMGELQEPSWKKMLENVVDVELDFAARNRLPGFLSESYTGDGAQYTGAVGIPDIAVTPLPRITNAASLYTLGIAYMVAPDEDRAVPRRQLADVSRLLTDHGPWEGFNLARKEPIRVQTTAHTLSLVLGLLGHGPENMRRYLDSKGLRARLDEVYKPGENVDFLSDGDPRFRLGRQGGRHRPPRGTATASTRNAPARTGSASPSSRPGHRA